MLSCLSHNTISSSYNQDSAVHLSSTSDHVLYVVSMSWACLLYTSAGGGCILNRSLADLTLLDIIKAADEEFFLNPCLDSQYQCGYAASFDGCKVHCELARVQRVLEEELKRTSLDRLFNKSG